MYFQEPINIHLLTLSHDGTTALRPNRFTPLKPAANGINKPWLGTLENGNLGFLKSCTATDEAMDEGEVWLAFIGEMLGIRTAKTFLALDKQGCKLGCLSLDVAHGGRFMTANEIKSQLFSDGFAPDWAKNVLPVYASNKKIAHSANLIFTFVEDVLQLVYVLEFVYGVLSYAYRYDVKQDFVNMVLFDCLFLQKDRNMDGFGLCFAPDGSVKMGELFDNASLSMPNIPDDLVGLCNILSKKELFAEAVTQLWPEQAIDFANRLEKYMISESNNLLLLQQELLTPVYSQLIDERREQFGSVLSVIRETAVTNKPK